jgi:hypothetical protein
MSEAQTFPRRTDEAGIGHNSDPVIASEQEIAQKIRNEYRQVIDAGKAVVSRARRFGEMLWEAKGKVGHGDWLDWLRDNCDLSKRTSQRYLELGKPPNKRRLDEALAKMKQEEKDNLTLAKAIELARGKEKEPTKNNASDRYDRIKKTLIEKLQDLSLAQAEAAIAETNKDLTAALEEMKNLN